MPIESAAPEEFRRCGVVGSGTMGTGIGYVLAAAGSRVTVVEPRADQVQRSVAAIAARLRKEQARSPDPGRAALLDGIDWVGDVAELPAGLDLVVESVPERIELKQRVLRAAEQRHPTRLATNTSGIAIAELAAVLEHPDRLFGLHFFNPVWSTPLLEIIRPETDADTDTDTDIEADTAAELVEVGRRLAVLLGKEAIVVADRPGFATTRLGVLLGLEAMRMLEAGVASAEDLDRAMVLGYRHPMGPLELTDLIGLDVRLDIARHLQQAYGDRFAPPQILIDKVARGELGRKSGQGFYAWQDGAGGPQPSEDVQP